MLCLGTICCRVSATRRTWEKTVTFGPGSMECQRDSGAWLEFERVQQRGGATKLPIQIPCKGLWKGRGSRKFLKGSQVPGQVDVLETS